ncbi:hypothetical protein KBC86_02400 [Candidatus Gracilibacteria bacterium]|nr:hypothetical protein [Candidatus Gracilibacteria bacterium]
MTQEILFASLSIFLYFLGFIPYIYHVFHGRVVPHPFTWTIWFIFSVTNLFIFIETTGIEPTFYSILARTLALFLGLSCGWWFLRKISLSAFDYVSLLLALLVILAMYLFGLREAVILMVIIDIIVLLPTIKKIWREPRTEDALAWFTTALSQGSLLMSLPFLSFENAFFWLYAICANLSVGLFIHLLIKKRESTLIGRVKYYVLMKKHDFLLALKNKL